MKPLLLAAVKALAQPPGEQIAALRGAHVDELALDLDAQPWHDEPPAIRKALAELDVALDSMSGAKNAQLWTPEALQGAEWQRIRQMARHVLDLHRH